MDTILIKGLEFYAYHGASDEEQSVGHRYLIDAWLTVDTRLAGHTDALSDTVSYAEAARQLVQIGTERQYRLLEALSARMVSVLFEEFPSVEAVRLRVQKISPPMNAIVASVGVELYRDREEVEQQPPRVRLTVIGEEDSESRLAED